MKNNVKLLRKERGLTQPALAKATGINIRLLQKLESGENDISGVRLKTLLAISDAFGVKIEDLFERDPVPTKDTVSTEEA